MNDLGENTEMVVKEKDDDENDSGEDAELNTCTDLAGASAAHQRHSFPI